MLILVSGCQAEHASSRDLRLVGCAIGQYLATLGWSAVRADVRGAESADGKAEGLGGGGRSREDAADQKRRQNETERGPGEHDIFSVNLHKMAGRVAPASQLRWKGLDQITA